MDSEARVELGDTNFSFHVSKCILVEHKRSPCFEEIYCWFRFLCEYALVLAVGGHGADSIFSGEERSLWLLVDIVYLLGIPSSCCFPIAMSVDGCCLSDEGVYLAYELILRLLRYWLLRRRLLLRDLHHVSYLKVLLECECSHVLFIVELLPFSGVSLGHEL